jgi:peroxiredoxin
MSKYLLSIFVCLISVSFAVAQEEYGVDTNHDLPLGLNVGDKAPYFKAHDLEGNLFDSKETLKDKDIILIFYRGHWCAACDMYLSNISDSLNLLSEKGAVVVAITPETPKNALKTVENTGVNFIILSDHNEEIMEGFDVVFKVNESYQKKIDSKQGQGIHDINEQDEARLPVPATFVIHRDGKIGFKHFDFDYNNRASVASLISYLD